MSGSSLSVISNRLTNFICDESAAQLLASLIAHQAKAGDCFALYGDLGTGKSTFARAFIQSLCGTDMAVSSPTFTISQSYESKSALQIWHYDLYRIENTDELYEIGLEETFSQAITLIEWPDIAKSLLPMRTMNISFAFADNSDYRHLQIKHYLGEYNIIKG